MNIYKKTLFILTILTLTLFSTNLFASEKLLNLQSLAKKLEKKEEELSQREKELNDKEKELNILKKDLELKQKHLEDLRNKLDDKLKEIKKIEDENLDKLAKIYASTKAKSAAEIISKMDLEKAVSLFQRIPDRAAGKIMTALGKLDSDFASKISERLTPDKSLPK
jgi:flagellar motility protein MotE (MotC chaperone)